MFSGYMQVEHHTIGAHMLTLSECKFMHRCIWCNTTADVPPKLVNNVSMVLRMVTNHHHYIRSGFTDVKKHKWFRKCVNILDHVVIKQRAHSYSYHACIEYMHITCIFTYLFVLSTEDSIGEPYSKLECNSCVIYHIRRGEVTIHINKTLNMSIDFRHNSQMDVNFVINDHKTRAFLDAMIFSSFSYHSSWFASYDA